MIEIKNLCVKYGQNVVYDGFNLDIEDGKITCILGESGCGKTTLLNAVAGLVGYEGSISQVKASYVFQSPRLIPYITVIKNLTAVGAERQAALNMLQRVGLEDKADAYPVSLSGGEAQRVSLCRALLFKSDLLLMDEPFSSLDLKTKLSAMELFKALQGEEGRSTLFVTHDVDEAVFLADRIVVIKNGAILSDLQNQEKCAYGGNSQLREQIIQTLIK
ncbi:MAG: ABC transporter ATP-binding protein [Clostridia bacterium]|nr:ABC transporter ATP-binding protein [Clostridia bacterium]